MISHRISTLTHCDEIFIFDDGQVIANGRYNELSDNNEKFQDLLLV